MRRKEKEITEISDIEDIIKKSSVCRVAFSVDNKPYLVPLCFGYHDKTLYFHSADQGKKLDMLKENPEACFELECETSIVTAKKACNWGLKYKSVIGYGKTVIVEDEKERTLGLDAIMEQYSEEKWEYDAKMLAKTVVFKISIESMSGKQSGD